MALFVCLVSSYDECVEQRVVFLLYVLFACEFEPLSQEDIDRQDVIHVGTKSINKQAH